MKILLIFVLSCCALIACNEKDRDGLFPRLIVDPLYIATNNNRCKDSLSLLLFSKKSTKIDGKNMYLFKQPNKYLTGYYCLDQNNVMFIKGFKNIKEAFPSYKAQILFSFLDSIFQKHILVIDTIKAPSIETQLISKEYNKALNDTLFTYKTRQTFSKTALVPPPKADPILTEVTIGKNVGFVRYVLKMHIDTTPCIYNLIDPIK